MNSEDCEDLERQLHALHTENASLRHQNERQRAQVAQLTARIGQLQTVASNQPIHLITQHLDPLSLDSALHRLEHKISAQAFELSFLHQLTQDKTVLQAEAQKRAVELGLQLEESKLQADMLSQQLKETRAREQRVRRQLDGWKARLDKSNQDHMRVLWEKEELTRQLSSEKSKNHAVLLDLAKKVASMRQSTAIQTSPSKDSSDFDSLSFLSQTQQMELQERNQEIARLKSINGNFSDSGEQHLKNTIKHLRGQLSRYSNLVQHVTSKLALAETTIIKYSSSADRCNKELASVEKLNEQIMKQGETIRSLQENLRLKTEEFQKERQAHLQGRKTLKEVLQENRCFHQFLFEIYGDNFQDLLVKERRHFEERLAARMQKERWTSVEELIQVNEQLRARLKI